MATDHRLLVRRPSPLLQNGELTHLDRREVDPELALKEWHAYVEAFAMRGWRVLELPALDEHPDGVFVEDMVVMIGNTAVLARPGASSRRGELQSMADSLAGLDVDVRRIEAPGTLEGGDVLKIGRRIYVGRSTRTNDAGIEQLTAIAEPLGFTV